MAHRDRKLAAPEEWLHEFVLAPGPDPQLQLAALEARLDQWATAHPSSAIVGPEWQRWARDDAAGYLRSRVAAGHAVAIEQTWLDGGDALWIR